MKTCTYCGKPECRHAHCLSRPEPAARPSAPVAPTATTTRDRSLFELTDRHELLCVLCSHVIPNGIDQTYLRAYHGKKHVRAGDAIEDRRGLPEGAVRYLVKSRAP